MSLAAQPTANLRDEIHIWSAALDCSTEAASALESNLTAEERKRAARFIFDRDRIRFIVGRTMMRDVLARYLGAAPSLVKLLCGPNGKPMLASTALNFNLAHSGNRAILAIASGRELGVDIELMREDIATDDVAQRFFSKEEVRELRALPDNQKVLGFFNCWTRKEAYVKARGEGLQMALDSFQVSLVPGMTATFISGVSPSWSLSSFTPAPGYVAAIAATGGNWHSQYIRWDSASAQMSA